ncbi:MAG: TerY-C metal binding domain-containing protein [Sulfuricellaceae bacterium]|nr:TerY-C metal binding domain-containing protein [Sulfuricellaceae bacterium]
MRRLPIYFVLDVSESMAGDNIRQLNQGLESLVKTLRTDPHALETVFLSVIVFAGKTRTLTPLVELSSFYPPRLPLGSGTSLGLALEHLMSEIDRTVIKTTADQKGDWRPVVYLLTDGKPTDQADAAIKKWKEKYSSRASMVAIGIGKFASLGILKKLTDDSFILSATSEAEFKKFIDWVSMSMSAQSRSVSAGPAKKISLAKLDDSIMKKVEEISRAAQVDEDFVILTGKCQTTKLPYIMRYERIEMPEVATADFKTRVDLYNLNGVFPLEADYFELSDERAMAQSVNSNSLIGTPGCPHCGNPIGFAVCSCGHLMCLRGPGEATCPWCNEKSNYSMSGPDDPGMDVTRSRG